MKPVLQRIETIGAVLMGILVSAVQVMGAETASGYADRPDVGIQNHRNRRSGGCCHFRHCHRGSLRSRTNRVGSLGRSRGETGASYPKLSCS